MGEVKTTIPTIGFNVETVSYKHITITCFDLTDNDKIRSLYSNYYKETTGIIFVVDSDDPDKGLFQINTYIFDAIFINMSK